MLLVSWDRFPHQLNEIIVEKWIESTIVDTEWDSVDYINVNESCLLQFLDEVTLRQGTGHSAGPGGRVSQDFGR